VDRRSATAAAGVAHSRLARGRWTALHHPAGRKDCRPRSRDPAGHRRRNARLAAGTAWRNRPVMTHARNYTQEQLIALARQRGIHPPENATDEELKVVERRLSAERGWICEPPPARLSDEEKGAALEALGRRFFRFGEPSGPRLHRRHDQGPAATRSRRPHATSRSGRGTTCSHQGCPGPRRGRTGRHRPGSTACRGRLAASHRLGPAGGIVGLDSTC
jgi:hypothetical protein